MKSYSQVHSVDYRAQASNATGYQISNDDGPSWSTSYANMLSTSGGLYVITSTSNAYNYWVSSPSRSYAYTLMAVNNSGNLAGIDLAGTNAGFRPLVCLSSDVKFEQLDDGNFIIK